MPELDVNNPHDQIDTERAAYVEERYVKPDSVKLFREYYKGKQPNTLTASQKAITEGMNVNNSCDNVSAQIPDEGAARLTLQMPEVRAGEGSTDESVSTLKEWIETNLWIMNHLPKIADETHRAAIRDGDYCLLPSWKLPTRPGLPGRIILYREPWWDGESGVWIQYDERDQPLYAVKEWTEVADTVQRTCRKRRDVWTDNALYRYWSPSGTEWERFTRPDDPTQEDGSARWPIPWVRPDDGRPLHIPYAHFRCDKPALAGGLLGQQDKLNDLGYAIPATTRTTAFQQIWVTGAETPTTGWKVGPGLVTELPEGSTTGIYPAGDISQLLSARDSLLQRIASAASMPTHSFSGQWPSGEALLRAELSAVNEALSRSEMFKPAWATLFHRATEIANAFGKAGLDENALIVCKYDSVDKLDNLKRFMGVSALFDAANKAVTAGVPLETFLAKYAPDEWTPADIEQLKADMQAREQQAQAEDAATMNRLMAAADSASGNGRQKVAA